MSFNFRLATRNLVLSPSGTVHAMAIYAISDIRSMSGAVLKASCKNVGLATSRINVFFMERLIPRYHPNTAGASSRASPAQVPSPNKEIRESIGLFTEITKTLHGENLREPIHLTLLLPDDIENLV